MRVENGHNSKTKRTLIYGLEFFYFYYFAKHTLDNG